MSTLRECLNPLESIGMMLEGSADELLARAAFMHHDDQGQDALMHHAVLKGLIHIYNLRVIRELELQCRL